MRVADMKNKIISMLMASAVIMLSACSAALEPAEAEASEEETTTVEESETEETTETTAAATETETEETTDMNLPWAERNGIVFESLQGIELPASDTIYQDGEVIEEVVFADNPAVYKITGITVSDPDEDGNVVYTLDYTIEHTLDVTIPYDVADSFSGSTYYMQLICVYDYYTGTVLAGTGTYILRDDPVVATVEYDGNVYEITTSVTEFSDECLSNDWWDIDDNTWECEKQYAMTWQLTITAPADYDGLILGIFDQDYDDEEDEEEINWEDWLTYDFGEFDEDDNEAYHFTLVKDLI